MRPRALGTLPLIGLWALPLVSALAVVMALVAVDGEWQSFFGHPQAMGGMWLALWTGSVSTVLALGLAIAMAMALHGSMVWRRLSVVAGAALAIPHLAFAIGFGFLIMPSGLVARLVMGSEAPPNWVTTQDPLGLSLIAVLVLKEAPFLLLMLWNLLAQGDAAHSFAGQVKTARGLGHGLGSVWLRVLLPQVLRRMLWPMVIVWVYGVSVVDLSLVIGPTQPPTIAAVIWNDLNDADLATNRRGLAGAVALVVLLGLVGALAWLLLNMFRPALRRFLIAGPSPRAIPAVAGRMAALLVIAVYAAVLLLLVLLSLTPRWPYPALLGEDLGLTAWWRIDWRAMLLSVWLAAATAVTAVVLATLWFESVMAAHDRWLLGLALLALALPSLTIAAGQYQLLLGFGLTGTVLGLYLVHLTPVMAYVFIVLSGPYRSFDGRFTAAGRALGAGRFRMWREVKLPLLRAPILAALAVGLSVSLVQFVPAQLIAAGRHSTLPMDAVTLASGGDRALTAAAALALTLPAVMAFGLSALLGRPRWR